MRKKAKNFSTDINTHEEIHLCVNKIMSQSQPKEKYKKLAEIYTIMGSSLIDGAFLGSSLLAHDHFKLSLCHQFLSSLLFLKRHLLVALNFLA